MTPIPGELLAHEGCAVVEPEEIRLLAPRVPAPSSMNAGGNAWCEANYGPHCKQKMVTITLFGHSIAVNAQAVRAFRRLDHVFREHDPKFYAKVKAGQCGCYSCRPVAGTSTWSMHAWCLAVDDLWSEMPRGTDPRDSIIYREASDSLAVVQHEGWRWGGWWPSPDPMHLELRLTPEQQKVRYHLDGTKKDGFKNLPNVSTI